MHPPRPGGLCLPRSLLFWLNFAGAGLGSNFPQEKREKRSKEEKSLRSHAAPHCICPSYEALLVVTRSIDVLVPEYGKGA